MQISKFAIFILMVVCTAIATAQVAPYEDLRYKDPRYCGVENIQRWPNGDIKRSAKVLEEFQAICPCPDIGKTTGACGHEKDHVIPLSWGGCDVVYNLGWMPPAMKSGAGKLPEDRWELKVYRYPIIITPVPIHLFLPILTK